MYKNTLSENNLNARICFPTSNETCHDKTCLSHRWRTKTQIYLHIHSLISSCILSLDTITHIDVIAKILRHKLASEAEQGGLCLPSCTSYFNDRPQMNCFCCEQNLFEPPHDKTNKMTVCPAKTQIIYPVWSESLLCAEWVAKDPSFLHADSEDSDQTESLLGTIYLLIEYSTKLLVTRTGIKARTSLILGHIRLLTLELLALEWRKFYTSRTWISLRPVGQSWSNFMCSIIGSGERLHNVLRQIGSKLWCPWLLSWGGSFSLAKGGNVWTMSRENLPLELQDLERFEPAYSVTEASTAISIIQRITKGWSAPLLFT